MLPHWSVAVHTRKIVLVLPQFVVTLSAKVTVTELQASVAVATPVEFVDVLAGHSRVRLAGRESVGGFVSPTVILWTAFVLLAESSVAVQVR